MVCEQAKFTTKVDLQAMLGAFNHRLDARGTNAQTVVAVNELKAEIVSSVVDPEVSAEEESSTEDERGRARARDFFRRFGRSLCTRG